MLAVLAGLAELAGRPISAFSLMPPSPTCDQKRLITMGLLAGLSCMRKKTNGLYAHVSSERTYGRFLRAGAPHSASLDASEDALDGSRLGR